MAVSDYNTDPDLNVDISGINIAEGCPPSGINNAIRQMMADIKDKADSTDTAITTLDANVVKLSGDQTISGTKTFNNTVVGKGGVACRRSSTSGNIDVAWQENDGTVTAACKLVSDTDATPRLQIAIKATSSTAWFSGPQVWLQRNGNVTIRTSNTSGGSTKDLVLNNSGTATWNGQTIQTSSDERLKTAFSSVPDAILDAWSEVNWQQFKYRDAVAEKGEDNCRWHTGLVAQHVQRTFEDQGQDALVYGILCHDEWQNEYETDDDGKKVLTRSAGDTWTVRYAEALCMEAAYQRRRADRSEARITALEQRIAEMEQAIAAFAGGAE